MKKVLYTTQNKLFETEFLILFDLQKKVILKKIDNDKTSVSWNINSFSFSPNDKFIAMGCLTIK